jgi:molybdenum cofactor cytidylyltransferase
MGKLKQTLPIRGKPMLEEVLKTFRKTKVDQIFVVLGSHRSEVMKDVEFKKEIIVDNPDFAKGMSSSIKAGLSAANASAGAAFIVLADQPFLSSETVDKLIGAYTTSMAPIVVPVYRGRRGNPVLFDRSLFPEIMELSGDSGAKTVILRNDELVLEVVVEDEGVVADVDTPSEYEGAVRR